MDFPFGIFKPVLAPVAGWLGGRKAVRRVRANLSRGRLSFRIPRGKTYILVPERPDGNGGFRVSAEDGDAAKLVQDMLTGLGYREHSAWAVHKVRTGQPVPEKVRRANVIALCTPEANPFVRDLLKDHAELFPVDYVASEHRPTRGFRWRNHAYRTGDDHDFAYLAVRRNPYNPERRVVLLFGLRGLGTLGAAKVFAEGDYHAWRQTVQKRSATLGGVLDLLLYVRGTPDGKVAEVREAREGDRVPAEQLDHAGVLRAISTSVEGYERRIGVSELVYTLTVTSDYGLRMEEEVTYTAIEKDIVLLNYPYQSSVPGLPIEVRDFRVSVTGTGAGSDAQPVVFLPVDDRVDQKVFLVFPLPPIAAGQSRRLHFSVLYPGGAQLLSKVHGYDTFAVRVSSKAVANIDSVSIRFLVETPGTYLVERVREGSSDGSADEREQCRINHPFQASFSEVPPAWKYILRVVRTT